MERIVQFVKGNLLTLLVLGALARGFFFLRTEPSDVGSVAELEAVLQGERPVLVELYLNT